MALVLAIGLLVTVAGAVGVVAPQILFGISRHALTPVWLYAAAALRIAIGIVLVRAAAGSRWPGFLRGLGWFVIAAGIVTLFLGVDRATAIVQWWSDQGPVLVRLLPALALVLGVILVRAALPRGRPA